MRVIWAKSATFARSALIDYIADDNVLAALDVDDTITAATLRLSDFPLLGKHGRIAGTRELVVHEHYILVYEVTEECIIVLMLLHTARQWPSGHAE